VEVNRKKLASIFGVSLPTIDSWVGKGMPALEEGGLGREWLFSTKECIAWWAEEQHRRRCAAIAPPGQESYEEAERRKMVAAADRSELQLAKDAGLVVPIEDVVAAVLDENLRVRNRLLAIPNEIRPRAQAMLGSDRTAVEGLVSVVEASILEAMQEIREGPVVGEGGAMREAASPCIER
jgi:phage terminase Nu1 subunit (DNA packaging protein)